MIKYISLGVDVDAEELLEHVNRFLLIKKDKNLGNTNVYLPMMVDNMERMIQAANLTYNVQNNIEIVSPSFIKLRLKKILKKLIGWYVNAVVKEQVVFNANIVRSLNEQLEITRVLVDKNSMLESKLEQLQLKMQMMEKGERDE